MVAANSPGVEHGYTENIISYYLTIRNRWGNTQTRKRGGSVLLLEEIKYFHYPNSIMKFTPGNCLYFNMAPVFFLAGFVNGFDREKYHIALMDYNKGNYLLPLIGKRGGIWY
jgi:hypothetical protein